MDLPHSQTSSHPNPQPTNVAKYNNDSLYRTGEYLLVLKGFIFAKLYMAVTN